MSYSMQQGAWARPVALELPVMVTAKDTKIAIPGDLPPMLDGHKRAILQATLVIINEVTGALTKTPLLVKTFATRIDDADEVYWIDHHTIGLPRAIAATQNFIELLYLPGTHGWQGKDAAAVAGTA